MTQASVVSWLLDTKLLMIDSALLCDRGVRMVQPVQSCLLVELCVGFLDEVVDLGTVLGVLCLDLVFVRLDEDADVPWVTSGNLARSGTFPAPNRLCGRGTRLRGSCAA